MRLRTGPRKLDFEDVLLVSAKHWVANLWSHLPTIKAEESLLEMMYLY